MPDSDENIHPADAFKALNQIFDVDPRNEDIEIATWHESIARITLVNTTPKVVKQLFENAKNIALYSYFSYRLHQPAEVIGYTALEKALKLKYEQEKELINVESIPKNLFDYMNIALEQGWITDEGYESSHPLATSRVESKLLYKMIDEGLLQSGVPVPEPTFDEIIEEMRKMGIAKRRLHAGRHVRNELVHGSNALSASSIGTLNNIAEEINQIFKQ